MPISPDRRALYPTNWNAISAYVRFGRAQGRCECTGQCGDRHCTGRCEEHHGQEALSFSGPVVLAAAHLDHDPTNNRADNVVALCQRCHIRHDRHHQAASRRRTYRRRRDHRQLCLPLVTPLRRPERVVVQLALPLEPAAPVETPAPRRTTGRHGRHYLAPTRPREEVTAEAAGEDGDGDAMALTTPEAGQDVAVQEDPNRAGRRVRHRRRIRPARRGTPRGARARPR